MKLGFCSDLHLDSVSEYGTKLFHAYLNNHESDVIVIAGDIAEAPVLEKKLGDLSLAIDKPIYYVNGNHDYYYSSVDEVCNLSNDITNKYDNIFWLQGSGVIGLTENTAICGHDGFYDCEYGLFDTDFGLWDFVLISDLKNLSRNGIKKKSKKLALDCAEHIRNIIPQAANEYKNIIFVTHVPPFIELSKYNGKTSEPQALPFFCSKLAGDALAEMAEFFPKNNITVLCGHTHDKAEYKNGNIHGICASAKYGKPGIYSTMEVL